MSQRVLTLRTDLSKLLEVISLPGVLAGDDRAANVLRVEVFDRGEPHELTGNITGVMILPNDTSLVVEGVANWNTAQIQLPQEAYALPGRLTFIIRETTTDSIKTTLAAGVCAVRKTSTETVVDPDGIVPNIDDVLARLREVEQATDRANTAAAAVPAMIAAEYSTSTAYVAGQTVYYDGHLYRFTADHAAGAWTGTDVVQIVLGDEVGGVISDVRAIDATLTMYDTPIYDAFALAQGGINTNGQPNDNVAVKANRRRTGYISALNGSQFVCESDYAICPFFYSNSTSWRSIVSYGDYVGNTYTLDAPRGAAYVRLVLKRTDDEDFGDEDAPMITYTAALRRLDVAADRLDSADERLDGLLDADAPVASAFTVVTGAIGSSGNDLDNSTWPTTRRRTSDYIPADNGSFIECSKKYTMALFFYSTPSENGYNSKTSDYVGSSYTVDLSGINKYFRIMFKRVDGGNFGDEEFPAVTYTHATRRLDTVEERLDEADLLVEKPASGQFVNGGYWRAGSALQPVNQPYYLISLFPVSDQVIKTKTASGYKMTAFAFSSAGTFDGFLHAYNTFTTTSTKDVYWTDEINFSELREKYPTDHFLIEVASDTTISGTLTEITTAEEANVMYVLSPCDTEPRAYYMAELAATIQSVRDALTEPALVFPMVTGIHYLALNNTFDYCIDNIKAFCKAVKCDFLLNLGDNADGNTAQAITLARNEYMLRRFAEIGLPYYFAIGNHDTNYKAGTSAIFSEEQMFKSYLANTRGVVFDMTEDENNYYKDFDELGIRLICLDANHLQQYTYSERTPT